MGWCGRAKRADPDDENRKKHARIRRGKNITRTSAPVHLFRRLRKTTAAGVGGDVVLFLPSQAFFFWGFRVLVHTHTVSSVEIFFFCGVCLVVFVREGGGEREKSLTAGRRPGGHGRSRGPDTHHGGRHFFFLGLLRPCEMRARLRRMNARATREENQNVRLGWRRGERTHDKSWSCGGGSFFI